MKRTFPRWICTAALLCKFPFGMGIAIVGFAHHHFLDRHLAWRPQALAFEDPSEFPAWKPLRCRKPVESGRHQPCGSWRVPPSSLLLRLRFDRVAIQAPFGQSPADVAQEPDLDDQRTEQPHEQQPEPSPHPRRRRDVERQVPGPQREWPRESQPPPKAGHQPRPRQPGRVDDQGAEPEHAAMREVRRIALQSTTPDQVDRTCLAAPDRQIGVPGNTHGAGEAGLKSRNCRRNCQIRNGKRPHQGPWRKASQGNECAGHGVVAIFVSKNYQFGFRGQDSRSRHRRSVCRALPEINVDDDRQMIRGTTGQFRCVDEAI